MKKALVILSGLFLLFDEYVVMKPRSGLKTGCFHIAKAKDDVQEVQVSREHKEVRSDWPRAIQIPAASTITNETATLAVAFLFVICPGIKESA